MPDQTKADLEVRVKELESVVKGLETENGRLTAENVEIRKEGQALLDEFTELKTQLAEPVEATFSDEHRTLIRDLAATYVRIQSDGRIDSRERDELNAKLAGLLAQVNALAGG